MHVHRAQSALLASPKSCYQAPEAAVIAGYLLFYCFVLSYILSIYQFVTFLVASGGIPRNSHGGDPRE